jgi:hypothetical protein
MKKLAFVVVLVAVIVGIVIGGLSVASAAKPTPPPPYKYTYTTGPFLLPENAASLDWAVLNNDSGNQTIRVTVFKCNIASPKTVDVPGIPLEVTIGPGETTHNANTYPIGYYYEIQVETNSQLVFPYVSVWPGMLGEVIPGTGISSGSFIRLMP